MTTATSEGAVVERYVIERELPGAGRPSDQEPHDISAVRAEISPQTDR